MKKDSIQLDAFRCSLELLLNLEKKKLALWEKELQELPEGRLCVIWRKGRPYFRKEIEGKAQGITRDRELVYKLARKQYVQLLHKERAEALLRVYEAKEEEKERWGVKNAHIKKGGIRPVAKEKLSPIEKLLDRYGRAGLELLRVTCSEEQYRWAKAKYRRNTANPEQLIYETYSGIKVRSKSERDIGNALEIRGIPYRYEPEVSLDIGWMEGVNGGVFGEKGKRYKNYYPDFVILTTTGDYLIWEHLGIVYEEGYRAHNMEKISAYRQSGFCDDAHLILTFEKDLVKPKTIERLIRQRVLPYI